MSQCIPPSLCLSLLLSQLSPQPKCAIPGYGCPHVPAVPMSPDVAVPMSQTSLHPCTPRYHCPCAPAVPTSQVWHPSAQPSLCHTGPRVPKCDSPNIPSVPKSPCPTGPHVPMHACPRVPFIPVSHLYACLLVPPVPTCACPRVPPSHSRPSSCPHVPTPPRVPVPGSPPRVPRAQSPPSPSTSPSRIPDGQARPAPSRCPRRGNMQRVPVPANLPAPVAVLGAARPAPDKPALWLLPRGGGAGNPVPRGPGHRAAARAM